MEGLPGLKSLLIDKHLNPDEETVEAGTSGGRILLELQKRGFKKLWGFDFVPEFIEQAKKRDLSGEITYDVMDATATNYRDHSFGQIIYLQQIICFIGSDDGRKGTVSEAYRILRPGGTALFSFLCHESRQSALGYRALTCWLKTLRMIYGCRRTVQYLPWLKHNGKANWSALLDKGPYVYWYKAAEAKVLLEQTGFKIISVGTDEQVVKESMQVFTKELQGVKMHGHIYFVCKK